MKIAVCLGGQIRTGIKAYDNIKNFFGDLWNSCDFFIHTSEWEFTKFYDRKIFRGKDLGSPQDKLPEGILLTDDYIDEFIKKYNPKRYEIQTKNLYTVINGIKITPAQGQFDVWYTKFRSLQLKQDYEVLNKFKYDVVIMMRPDLIFFPGKKLSKYIKEWDFNPKQIYYNLDLFWIMSSSTADFLKVGFYDELLKNSSHRSLGPQLSGEEISDFFPKNNIEMKNIMSFDFTILRKEAKKFNPIDDYEYCRNIQYLYFTNIDEKQIKLPTDYET